MKKLQNVFLSLTIIICLTQCQKDNDSSQELATKTSDGIFIDSPVEGLNYVSASLSGKTDSNGKFEYEDGKTISFNVGGISIGKTNGKAVVTPLDLIDNGDVNNQNVRNIASFLQSLDYDNNPSNGIKINMETEQALNNKSLDFTSDNFFIELTVLIEEINTINSSSLMVVNSNTAALHLAVSLNLENEFDFLPRVIQGRKWEEGDYYTYNSPVSDEYVLRIGSDLTGVRYNFGNNVGYYMDMVYTQDTLSGKGNLYTDINSNPPVKSAFNYEYRNRILSPGAVFDYGDKTYLGYYNYYKKEGELGRLEGVYQGFFYIEQKKIGEEEKIQFAFKNEIIIENQNSDGNYPVLIKKYDENDNLKDIENKVFNKDLINNENILLIRFQDTDYLFINYDINSTDPDNYLSPGLFTVKR